MPHEPSPPSAKAPLALRPGCLVDGRYEVRGVLGSGSMGAVYLAHDSGLDRAVALKVVHNVTDPALMGAFMREARSLACVRSPHVVQVYAFGQHHGLPFFAMELVEGPTLAQLVEEQAARGQTLPLARSLELLEKLASGLATVHAAGLIHRDVKPANVVIAADGRPVLVDFGLAATKQATKTAAGTPAYVAPEQASGRSVTSRSDVYALGCTAFEMLTGKLPFPGASIEQILARHASDPRPAVSGNVPALWVFDAPVARAMAPDPADRFPSCTNFAQAMRAASDTHGRSTPPESGPRAERSSRPREEIDILAAVEDAKLFDTVKGAVRVAFFGRRTKLGLATSARELLERAAAAPPRLLVVDLDGPALGGLEALSALRRLPGGGATVVLGLCAPGALRAQRFVVALAGVTDLLPKPVDLATLVERLGVLGERANITPELAALADEATP